MNDMSDAGVTGSIKPCRLRATRGDGNHTTSRHNTLVVSPYKCCVAGWPDAAEFAKQQMLLVLQALVLDGMHYL